MKRDYDAENRELSAMAENVKTAVRGLVVLPVVKKRPSWGDPGSRVTRRTSATVYSRGARAVLVTIYPDGVIGLRLSKHRREEYVNASDIYRQAVTARVNAERAAKRKARKGK